MIAKLWEADPTASFARRLGVSPEEAGGDGDKVTDEHGACPDIWELSNGDVAVIGRDLTASYRSRLPDGVSLRADERLVVIPRVMIIAAKADIPDA
jgi:hypothetical protein